MNAIESQIQESCDWVKEKCQGPLPKVAIVLGSGLGSLLDELSIEAQLPYQSIPHMRPATVKGHAGRLLIGQLAGVRVACLQGRLHFYEGYPMHDVVFPFRVFARAGVEAFFLTNAAGGIHPEMELGDLVLIQDHINQMGTNPLIGPNIESLGPRFPDLTDLYSPELRKHFRDVAQERSISLREGIYVATHGPSFETPAEIQAFKKMGADVVGMSTVPEAIALAHMGKKVVAISCVTNLAAGVAAGPVAHEEVLSTASRRHGPFLDLVKGTLPRIAAEVGG